jgi:hypothetical protein
VWAVGFIIALLTVIDGHRMAIVPSASRAYPSATVQVQEGSDTKSMPNRDVLVLPDKAHFPAEELREQSGDSSSLKLRVARGKSYGVIFATTLLLVIIITNVPLRGMWSVVVLITVIMLVIIFSLAGWWDTILGWLFLLHIHINTAGYLFISLVLFAVWLVTFLFFDQQVYMIFTPGQVKVCTEIGGGEKAFDTTGMTTEKQRSDLFRHWILGLGSGDLVFTTTGAAAEYHNLPNVLFIGRKLRQIQDMQKERAVVRGK